jgi:hypothetical protein
MLIAEEFSEQCWRNKNRCLSGAAARLWKSRCTPESRPAPRRDVDARMLHARDTGNRGDDLVALNVRKCQRRRRGFRTRRSPNRLIMLEESPFCSRFAYRLIKRNSQFDAALAISTHSNDSAKKMPNKMLYNISKHNAGGDKWSC